MPLIVATFCLQRSACNSLRPKSFEEENLEEINGELLDQVIAKIKLDELKKLVDFQSYNDVENIPSDSLSVDTDFKSCPVPSGAHQMDLWDRNCCSLKPCD
jgi:hypothetical protein